MNAKLDAYCMACKQKRTGIDWTPHLDFGDDRWWLHCYDCDPCFEPGAAPAATSPVASAYRPRLTSMPERRT
jgi:hypothetical protein